MIQQTALVKKIAQLDRYTLGVEWTDGHRSHWRLATLRRRCPCASCVDEWTGEAKLQPEAIDDDILATLVESVGQYALRVHFTDGHNTGIFTYAHLREIDEALNPQGSATES